MKLCPKCSVERPDDAFYVRATGNLQSWCIACTKELRVQRNPQIAAYQRKKRSGRTEEEKLLSKDYMLQYHFGISLDDYREMLERQDYSCAVCKRADGTDKHSGERKKQLSVDHDHTTGAIRGLLCNDCNRALGQLGDDVDRVRALLAYMERFEARKSALIKGADDMIEELRNM